MRFMQAKAYGPGMAGALFGAGWWFYVDAVSTSSQKIPFLQVGLGVLIRFALIQTASLTTGRIQIHVLLPDSYEASILSYQ